MFKAMVSVGKKIRELRLGKDWTLADLSKHSGVALSSLSRIETGKMTGTLDSHLRVARALGVRLLELYSDLDPAGAPWELRRETSDSGKLISGRGSTALILSRGSLGKKMLPLLLTLKPGKNAKPEQAPSGVEKFLYLLKGKLEVMVGKDRLALNPGDSLYLQATLPHAFKNTGPSSAVALCVTAPPSV